MVIDARSNLVSVSLMGNVIQMEIYDRENPARSVSRGTQIIIDRFFKARLALTLG